MVLETVGAGRGRLGVGVVRSGLLWQSGSILGSDLGTGVWVLDESIVLPELF